jgi:hypothetical protein
MNVPSFWRNVQSRYNLTGVRCTNCQQIYFPPRPLCPQCRRLGRLERENLRGVGTVLTYTVIRSASEGFHQQTPYIMAVVQLEDGPCLTTQIVDCKETEIEIGMPVERVFRKITEDGEAGLIHYGYKFRPRRDER